MSVLALPSGPPAAGWPDYQSHSPRTPWWAYRRLLFTAHAGRTAVQVLALGGLYLAGIFIPLPWVAAGPDPPARSWLFLLLSDAMTGGALERGAWFASGLWVPVLLEIVRFGRQKAAPLPLHWQGASLYAVSLGTALFLAAFRPSLGMGRVLVLSLLLWLGAVVLSLASSKLKLAARLDLLSVNCLLILVRRFVPDVAPFFRTAPWKEGVAFGVLVLLVPALVYLSSRQHMSVSAQCVKDADSKRRSVLNVRMAGETLLVGLSVLAMIVFLAFAVVAHQAFAWLSPLSSLVLSCASLAIVFGKGSRVARLLSGFAPQSIADTLQSHYWVIDEPTRQTSPAHYRVGGETASFLRHAMAAQWRRSLGLFAGGILCLVAANALLLRSLPQAVTVSYGPIVQLWVCGTLLTFVAELFDEMRALAYVEFAGVAQSRLAVPQGQALRTEIQRVLPPGLHDELVEVVSEGIFSSDPQRRREAVRHLLQEIRAGGAAHEALLSRGRRLLESLLITATITVLLLAVLWAFGLPVRAVQTWLVVLPFTLQILAQVVIDYVAERKARRRQRRA